jgi:alkylhydroperoxidase family enzyme
MTDTVLTRIPRDQLAPALQEAWDRLTALTGNPTFIEVLATAPHVMAFTMGDFYQKLFFGGAVGQRAKQLLRLQLSLIHGCRSCNRQNIPGAREAGVSDAQIDALIAGDDSAFAEDDRAVLALARELALTNTHGRLDGALHARLKRAFSDAEILELCVVAGVLGGLNKMSFALGLVDMEETCPFRPAQADAA